MSLTRQQALDCFASHDLIGIGMEADAVRRRLHPEGVVSYCVDATISLTIDPLPQIAAALDQGVTGIILETSNQPPFEQFERILATIRRGHPNLRIQALSAPEITSFSSSPDEVLTRLRHAGLDALRGHGADLLNPAQYLQIHRAAHRAGIASTAALTFGGPVFGEGEPAAHLVSFLESLHALQEETHGFLAFTLTAHHPLGGRDLDDATAVEYLKTLAICRMVLDNIPNIQSDWEQQGLKVLQMGLRFGGNDAGSILPASAQAGAHVSEEEIRRVIRDAGFKPVQRDTLFRTMFLN